MKNIIIAAFYMLTIFGLFTAAHAASKPPVIAGTYTPPSAEDWGCGKGKPITIRADKSRICPVDKRHK